MIHHSGKKFPKLSPEILKLIKWLALHDRTGIPNPFDKIELLLETWKVVLSKVDRAQVHILIADYKRTWRDG